MAHTIHHKGKIIARVRRIRGQLEALERALQTESECAKVLQLIASVRGATSGLMAEVMEGHIREHVLEAVTVSERQKGAQELVEVVKAYLR